MDSENDIEEELEKLRVQVKRNTLLLEKNNKILKTIQSTMRTRTVFSIIYWMIIIGSMFGLYYYFQPVLTSIQGAYEELLAIPDKLKVF